MDHVVQEAEDMREEGNVLFEKGEYADACAKYEVARPTACAPRYPLRLRFPLLPALAGRIPLAVFVSVFGVRCARAGRSGCHRLRHDGDGSGRRHQG
jgi:hypothetical protein